MAGNHRTCTVAFKCIWTEQEDPRQPEKNRPFAVSLGYKTGWWGSLLFRIAHSKLLLLIGRALDVAQAGEARLLVMRWELLHIRFGHAFTVFQIKHPSVYFYANGPQIISHIDTQNINHGVNYDRYLMCTGDSNPAFSLFFWWPFVWWPHQWFALAVAGALGKGQQTVCP